MVKNLISILLMTSFFMINVMAFSIEVNANEAVPEFVAEEVASIQVPRGNGLPVAINGKIYFVGGVTKVNPGLQGIDYLNEATNILEVYDPAINTWEVLSSMKYAREAAAVVTVQTPDGFTDLARIKVIDKGIDESNQTKHLAIDLPVNETITLIVVDSRGDNELSGITWKSSNPDIVTVNSFGEVTAVSAGYTTMIAETQDGQWTAVIMVRVY